MAYSEGFARKKTLLSKKNIVAQIFLTNHITSSKKEPKRRYMPLLHKNMFAVHQHKPLTQTVEPGGGVLMIWTCWASCSIF